MAKHGTAKAGQSRRIVKWSAPVVHSGQAGLEGDTILALQHLRSRSWTVDEVFVLWLAFVMMMMMIRTVSFSVVPVLISFQCRSVPVSSPSLSFLAPLMYISCIRIYDAGALRRLQPFPAAGNGARHGRGVLRSRQDECLLQPMGLDVEGGISSNNAQHWLHSAEEQGVASLHCKSQSGSMRFIQSSP